MILTPVEFQNVMRGVPDKHEVPFILHLTWKTSTIPEENEACVKSWEVYNPDLMTVLWDDESIVEFINCNYPEYSDLCRRFMHPVELADLFRYLIIYHWGGIYADLDVECLRPINDLLKQQSSLFCCIEKYTTSSTEMKQYKLLRQIQLCQWFFGGPKKCLVLKVLCDKINENYPQLNHSELDAVMNNPLENTGPAIFSDVLLEWKRQNGDILIFPQYFFAYGSCLTTGLEDNYPSWVENPPEYCNKLDFVYVRHYFQGSWKIDNTY